MQERGLKVLEDSVCTFEIRQILLYWLNEGGCDGKHMKHAWVDEKWDTELWLER
jgi:hypothetical protein